MLSTALTAAILLGNLNEGMAKSHALDVKVKLVKTTNKKIRLFVNQPNTALEVALRNEAGEVLYSGFVSNLENIGKQFDLTALADGNYTLEVVGSNFHSSQNIAIKNGVINIVQGGYDEVEKPEFRSVGNNTFGLYTDKKVFVTITNRYGEGLYEDSVNQNKGFNLDSLPAGEYKFTFVVGEKSFTETVKVVK